MTNVPPLEKSPRSSPHPPPFFQYDLSRILVVGFLDFLSNSGDATTMSPTIDAFSECGLLLGRHSIFVCAPSHIHPHQCWETPVEDLGLNVEVGDVVNEE